MPEFRRIEAGAPLPPLARGECHIWWGGTALAQPHLLDWLSDRERQRWSALRQAGDRDLYLVAHALARGAMASIAGVAPSKLEFTQTCKHCGGAHGKPRLRHPALPLELSLSHSGSWAVAALAFDVPLGIDVERITPWFGQAEAAGLILSPAERARAGPAQGTQRPEALARLWTRKEAALKATGDGLLVEPSQLTMSAPGEAPALLGWNEAAMPLEPVHLRALEVDEDHAACLATIGAALRVHHQDGASLLQALSCAPL